MDIPIEMINKVEKTETAESIIVQEETIQDDLQEEPENSKENDNKSFESKKEK